MGAAGSENAAAASEAAIPMSDAGPEAAVPMSSDAPATPPPKSAKRPRPAPDSDDDEPFNVKRQRILDQMAKPASPGKKRCCIGGPGAAEGKRCKGHKARLQQKKWAPRPAVAVDAWPFANDSPEICLSCYTNRYKPALKQQQSSSAGVPAVNSAPGTVSKYVGGKRRQVSLQLTVLSKVTDILAFCTNQDLNSAFRCSRRMARAAGKELNLRIRILAYDLRREKDRTRQLRQSRDFAKLAASSVMNQLREARKLLGDEDNVNAKLTSDVQTLLAAFGEYLRNQRFDGATISFKERNGMVKREFRTLLAELYGKEGCPMDRVARIATRCYEAIGFTVEDVPGCPASILRFVMELDLVAQYETALALAGRTNLNIGHDGTSTWWKTEHETINVRFKDEHGEIEKHFLSLPQFIGSKDAESMANRVEAALATVRERQQELGIPEEKQTRLTSCQSLSADNTSANTGKKKGLSVTLEKRRDAEHKAQVAKRMEAARVELKGATKVADAVPRIQPLLQEAFPKGIPHASTVAQLLLLTQAALIALLTPWRMDGCNLHAANLVDVLFGVALRTLDSQLRPDLHNPSMIKNECFAHYVIRVVYKLLKFSPRVDALLHLDGEDGRRVRVSSVRWHSKTKYGFQLACIWDSLMRIEAEFGAALLPR
jgi:hypothetical protein